MNISLVAVGSRGDVQPAIALGKGIKLAGHTVRIIAGEEARGFIESHDLEARVLPLNVIEILSSDAGKNWVESGRKPSTLQEIKAMKAIFDQHGLAVARSMIDLLRDSDLILSGLVGFPYADSIGQVLGTPTAHMFLQPWMATRQGKTTIRPVQPKQVSTANWVAGYALEFARWQVYKDSVRPFRQELNLPEMRFMDFHTLMHQTPTLFGFSPQIAPPPADWDHDIHHVTGYWFLDDTQDFAPPEDLQAFLEDTDDAPIYVGFGSMSQRNARDTTHLIVNAACKAGCRVVLSSGWAGLAAENLSDNVYMLGSVPHGWLFPQMAGIVHHGGAGTTSAALRAGVPSTIVHHIVDQPYWGRRVHELGVGTKPISRYHLTSDNLAAAMRQMLTNYALRRNAEKFAEKIRAEDGVHTAVQWIEAALLTGQPVLA